MLSWPGEDERHFCGVRPMTKLPPLLRLFSPEDTRSCCCCNLTEEGHCCLKAFSMTTAWWVLFLLVRDWSHCGSFFDFHRNRPHSATVVKDTVAECGRFLSRQRESIICPKRQIIDSASSCVSVRSGIFFEMRTARSG